VGGDESRFFVRGLAPGGRILAPKEFSAIDDYVPLRTLPLPVVEFGIGPLSHEGVLPLADESPSTLPSLPALVYVRYAGKALSRSLPSLETVTHTLSCFTTH